MPETVHTSVFDGPVDRVAHDIAVKLLSRASAAGRRLAQPDDREALHDFRVALRRLRTWLRAFGAYTKIGAKLHAPLGDIMHLTNAARDADVALAWLGAQRGTLDGARLVGLDWLAAQLEEESRHGHKVIAAHVRSDWAGHEGRLQKRLARAAGQHGHQDSFARVAGAQVVASVEKLAARIDGVRTLTDLALAHQARISAKHLRYLLEPLSRELPEAEEIVARLAALQDELGDLHDAGVLLDRLIDATEAAAMEDARVLLTRVLRSDFQEPSLPGLSRRDTRAGLLILTHRAKQQETVLFEQVIDHLRAQETAALLNEARAAGESLAA